MSACAPFQPNSLVPRGFTPASHSMDVWSNSAMVEKIRPLVIQIYGLYSILFFYRHDMDSVRHILFALKSFVMNIKADYCNFLIRML